MEVDERKVREAAARLVGNQDYTTILNYMERMFRELVLSADPDDPDALKRVHYEYNAILEVEAQVHSLATGAKRNG